MANWNLWLETRLYGSRGVMYAKQGPFFANDSILNRVKLFEAGGRSLKPTW